EERYGLDRPGWAQYLRWLNNISPLGFYTWTRDDEPVKKALQQRRDLFTQIEPQVRKEHPQFADGDVRKEMRRIARQRGIAPLPGDLRFDRVPIKWPNLG